LQLIILFYIYIVPIETQWISSSHMIEEFGNRQNLGMCVLQQAIANTLIIEKFQITWTQKSDGSVGFLVQMTKQLTELYQE
jgi:hypothetical protein